MLAAPARLAGDRQAVFLLARAELGLGDLEAAARDFERVTALRPDDANAWNDLGAVQAMRGDRAAARLAFERALAADPSLASARSNLERLASGRPEGPTGR